VPRATALGCRAIQVFVKNANRWRASPIPLPEAEAFRAARSAAGLGPAVAHASYLINLAASDDTVRRRSEAALADELERCDLLGLDGLVVHPGAHLGSGEEAGFDRVAAMLDRVLAGRPTGGPRVLLENTAGQGTALGWRLEHLAAIRRRLARPDEVGACLDTCHAFAAGYPLHEAAGYEEFVAELAEVVGLERIACWHLNDSRRPFASRRDRHEHIGEGAIGRGLFARLLHDPRFTGVPMVLETEPGEGGAGHRRDLEVLRGLAAPG
jgi:deoxyribonuclease-4